MYLVTGSVTQAARLAKAIESSSGFFADVVHTPPGLSEGGCSYSVKVKDSGLDWAKKISLEKGIKIKNIYVEKKVNGERVFYDIY